MGVTPQSYTKSDVQGGLDADKPPHPLAKEIYIATDTQILYICFEDDVWTGQPIPVQNPLSTDSDGVLRYNGTPLIPVSSTKSGTEAGVTGQDWYEHLAGQIGYMSQADYNAPANGFTIGMRMTDAAGNVLDEWLQSVSGRTASIPGDIMQRFAKTKTSNKLYVRNYRFTTSGAITLTYSETAAFVKV
ncbi:hypothetical protein MsAg5_10360 [Methanosarcinaceae archaeon Ag5]|uniref:Uncharacterized protein n=1 Tax=Methanolapillus africanus TaxID=3028297 RepID=A0AAE4SDV5_9EURY|nr:hypothetical protein [Methanosarcinaceae archaeon Ag5]